MYVPHNSPGFELPGVRRQILQQKNREREYLVPPHAHLGLERPQPVCETLRETIAKVSKASLLLISLSAACSIAAFSLNGPTFKKIPLLFVSAFFTLFSCSSLREDRVGEGLVKVAKRISQRVLDLFRCFR